MYETIKEKILASIPDATIHIANPRQDGRHFEAIVISASFEGLSLVRQHQLVMNALKSSFDDALHAFALKTFTPEKWNASQDQSKI